VPRREHLLLSVDDDAPRPRVRGDAPVRGPRGFDGGEEVGGVEVCKKKRERREKRNKGRASM